MEECREKNGSCDRKEHKSEAFTGCKEHLRVRRYSIMKLLQISKRNMLLGRGALHRLIRSYHMSRLHEEYDQKQIKFEKPQGSVASTKSHFSSQ